jgi:pimeloyl-ACP methyl ester carboxylesterase
MLLMSWWQIAAFSVMVLLLIGAAYQRLGVWRDARRLPPPGRLLDIGGRRLHLHCVSNMADSGDIPVSVIFESGIAASSLNWRRVQAEIAELARACSYDRAGFGWSDPGRSPRSARAAVADLRRLLQAAQMPAPYVLVGHSYGGYVILTFAAEYPREVAGLVLVDAITPEEWMAPAREQRRVLAGGVLLSYIGAALASVGVVRYLLNRAQAGALGLPNRVLRGFGREADSTVRRIVGEITKMPEEIRPAVQAHWSRARSFVTMAQHFRALPRSAAELHALLFAAKQCPLRDVPIWAVSSAGCSAEQLRGQAAVAGLSQYGSHVRAVTGGHWVHLDEPQIVCDAIRFAVEQTAARRARDASRAGS